MVDGCAQLEVLIRRFLCVRHLLFPHHFVTFMRPKAPHMHATSIVVFFFLNVWGLMETNLKPRLSQQTSEVRGKRKIQNGGQRSLPIAPCGWVESSGASGLFGVLPSNSKQEQGGDPCSSEGWKVESQKLYQVEKSNCEKVKSSQAHLSLKETSCKVW